MTTHYNKAKLSGVEQFNEKFSCEKCEHEGTPAIHDQPETIKRFLSTFADSIKEAVEKDMRSKYDDEIKKMFKYYVVQPPDVSEGKLVISVLQFLKLLHHNISLLQGDNQEKR